MDQHQSREKLLANFKGHLSIRIFLKTRQRAIGPYEFPPEIHMDQWLPNLSESSGLHRHRSIECSSLQLKEFRQTSSHEIIGVLPAYFREKKRAAGSCELLCLWVAGFWGLVFLPSTCFCRSMDRLLAHFRSDKRDRQYCSK